MALIDEVVQSQGKGHGFIGIFPGTTNTMMACSAAFAIAYVLGQGMSNEEPLHPVTIESETQVQGPTENGICL
jgi:hypothetical protein